MQSILEDQRNGSVVHQRWEQGCEQLVLRTLEGHDDTIAFGHFPNIRVDIHFGQMKVPEFGVDANSMRFDEFRIGSHQEMDLCPNPGKQSSVESSQGSCANDRKIHLKRFRRVLD
jgi:hypothetical protein